MRLNDVSLSHTTINMSIQMSSTKTMSITIMLCLQRPRTEAKMMSIAITQDLRKEE